MLKKHMAACLVATAFAAAPAFAQTSTTPSGSTDRPAAAGSGSTTTGSPAMQPSTANPPASSSSMSSSSMNQSGGMQGQFMTQMQQDHMMASKLIGTRVISANNESIGDINDVIVDRTGQAVAAVVGVGGFLGIGEKDVAVPFKSLEFATREQVNAMNGNNANGGNVSTTGSTATTGTTAGTSPGAGTTASPNAANTTGSTAAGNNSNSNNNEPERVILRMTKADLQAAPTFNTDLNNATGSSAPNTTAPKQ
jgi:sporulation protein YlmC with PRC-barrel domain